MQIRFCEQDKKFENGAIFGKKNANFRLQIQTEKNPKFAKNCQNLPKICPNRLKTGPKKIVAKKRDKNGENRKLDFVSYFNSI